MTTAPITILDDNGHAVRQGDVVQYGRHQVRAMEIRIDEPDQSVVGYVELYDADGPMDSVPVELRGGYYVAGDITFLRSVDPDEQN